MSKKPAITASAITALCTTMIGHAHTVLYDFNSGLDGWTNVTSPTTAATGYESATSGLFGGNATAGLVVPQGTRDSAGDLPLWITSPVFSMPSDPINEISFQEPGDAVGVQVRGHLQMSIRL